MTGEAADKPAGILGPNGQPTRNRCVAFRCGVEIPIPRMMCDRHWANVPKHIKAAIVGEGKWLDRHKRQQDQHSMALIAIATSRELQRRMMADPKLAAEVIAEMAENEAKAKAQASGLVAPDGKALVVPR